MDASYAQFSPDRYRCGPTAQDVMGRVWGVWGGGVGGGGGGLLYLTQHSHHQNDSALRWAATRATLIFH